VNSDNVNISEFRALAEAFGIADPHARYEIAWTGWKYQASIRCRVKGHQVLSFGIGDTEAQAVEACINDTSDQTQKVLVAACDPG